MEPKRTRRIHRFLGAGVTTILLAGAVAIPANAAPPIKSGPTITIINDGACNFTVTYTGKVGKFAEIDMTAGSYGLTSPTDATPGWDVWAGSEHMFGPKARDGSYTAVFRLTQGGQQKEFEVFGWAYRVEGTYLNGSGSPYVKLKAYCTFTNHEYDVYFHNGYTEPLPTYPGYGSFLDLQRAKFGNPLSPPAAPVRSGYTFAGWRVRGESVNWNFSDGWYDRDDIMFAQWIPIV